MNDRVRTSADWCERGAPAGLPFRFDEDPVQRGLNFTLITKLGALGLFGEITGGGSYARLIHGAETIVLFGQEYRCLSLEQLIAVKRAARPSERL